MRFITLLLFLSCSIVSYTQEVYNYNQNYQIREYVKNNELRLFYTFLSMDGVKTIIRGKYKINKIDLQYKDQEGNQAYALQMVRPKKKLLFEEDTIYLLPDNQFYPTHLIGLQFKNGEPNEIGKFLVLNGGYIKNIEVQKIGATHIYDLPPSSMYFVMYFDIYKTKEWIFKGEGEGQIKNAEDFETKLKIKPKVLGQGKTVAPEYPGIAKLMQARNAFMDEQLNKAKNSNHQEELSKLIESKEYIVYESNSTGYVNQNSRKHIKLIVERDEKGLIKDLTVHEPFTDGKFYDKEKFYTKCTKETDGLFTYKFGNDHCKLFTYHGYIVGAAQYSNVWRPIFVLTNTSEIDPKLIDIEAHNIATEISNGFGAESSAKWWCKTQLEELYVRENDPYYFYNFFNNYVNALINK